MQGPSPILDYSSEQKSPGRFPWQITLSYAGIILSPLFMCMCGHLNTMVLGLTVPATILGWWGASGRVPLMWRLLGIGAAVVATMLLGKNLLDVLWFGHDPIFT